MHFSRMQFCVLSPLLRFPPAGGLCGQGEGELSPPPDDAALLSS